MHGARKKHEIYDVSWSLGLHIEHETLCEGFLSGVSMDRKKFFDLLQYEVGYFILGALGAPSGVLVAAQNFYQKLQCMKATTDYFSQKSMASHKLTASVCKWHWRTSWRGPNI